jgi:DNA mismatch repair protein MutS2
MEEEFFHTSRKLEFDLVLQLIADYAESERAKKTIKEIKPLPSTEDIERNQSEIVELVNSRDIGETIPIAGWEDTGGVLEEIAAQGTIVENREMVQIARGENQAVRVKEYFSKNSDSFSLLGNYSRKLVTHEELATRILSIIGDDYEIVDNASKRLSELRKEIRSAQKTLRKRFTDFAADRGKGDGREFVTIRGNRYVVALSRSNIYNIKGIVHHESSSGASVFIEPFELIEENNRLEALVQDERKEIIRILRELTNDIHSNIENLVENQDILCQLDIINASARFSRRFQCCKPKHSLDGRLILRKARHPLLQRQFEKDNKRDEIVGLDFESDSDLKIIVISGPNAGGKTVVLKTIGLIILMNRTGLLIPALSGTIIPNYKNVLVDIGDDQSIKKSLSTFSSRVLRIKRIFSIVDSEMMVIIDEIGDGTSHEEGEAIAEVVLAKLKDVCGKVIVTTHYTGLKGWAHEENGVINATMEFDSVNLKPLYTMRLGVPGRSWGLETARRLGLSDDLIRAASEKLDDSSQDLEGLLSYLEDKRQLLEENLSKSRDMQKRLADLATDYGERLNYLNKNADKYEKEARKEALKVVSEARTTVEGLVSEIRETQADKKSIKRAKDQIAKSKRLLEEKVKRDEEVQYVLPGEVKPGQWMRIVSLGKEAKVISVSDSERVFMEFEGGIRVETSIEDIVPLTEKRETSNQRKVKWAASAEPVYPEIMIRGLEKIEALEMVDHLIDRAVLQGLGSVRIIHGIGKGILKRAVYNRLRKDPRVKDIHPGEPAIGGDGVAVVELK